MTINLFIQNYTLKLLVIIGVFTLQACKKYQPTDSTFFLVVDTVKVAPAANQGSASHKITDLWLYVNGNFQGAYPVGNMMPIVTKGNKVSVEMFAGIKNNGISETRFDWKIYQKIKFDTLLPSGTQVKRPITFTYNTGAQFPWIEDFESTVGVTLKKSSSAIFVSDTTFKTADPSDAFEGKSIELGLGVDGVVARVESAKAFTLTPGNPNVYLELNYKCNAGFAVGLIGENELEKPALNINAHPEWNKIYIQLTYAVSSDPVSNTYRVYFKLINTGGNPKIFLDNIKLVYI